MRITILTENHAGINFQAEHGLSYLIEIDGRKILFDAGHSDVFLKNAAKLGININNEVDTVVLSHGHWDHTFGLQYLEGKTIITHPRSLDRMLATEDYKNIRFQLSATELEEKFVLKPTRNPLNVTEHLVFLGEIPRKNDYESQPANFGIDENGNKDFIPDDSALAAITGNELVIITGCSHSGITNITEYAKTLTGIRDVKAVLGGFHLQERDEQTEKTVTWFQKNQVGKLYPSHCTQLPALAAFYEAFHTGQLKTGMVLEF